MSTHDDHGLENLIAATEQTLGGIGDVDRLTAGLSKEAPESLQTEIRKDQLRSLADAYGIPVDAYIEVSVDPDGMTAAADLFAGREGGRMLEPGDIVEELAAQGVISGIDVDAYQQAMLQCNTEGTPVSGLVIARGTPAVGAVPAHLEIAPHLVGQPATAQPHDDHRIDHRERAFFNLVTKGEVLARMVGERPGRLGINVHGEALPFAVLTVPRLTAGRNTVSQGSQVMAAVDGRFEKGTSVFSVNPVLHISGGVDYRTGHVKFPGDVMIHGAIQDGFKVHAGGSLYCSQTLDASDIVCRGNLDVQQGIIGRKEGTVRVGGSVQARFIENCYLEARERVYVHVGIMNSAVHTLGRLEMGPRGIIVGGRIHAQHGVIAVQIGSSMGPRTEIYCGLDYTVLHKLEYIKAKNMELFARLRGLEMRKKSRDADLQRIAPVEARIREATHKLNEAAQALVLHLDKQDDADVVVIGTIHPGAYIEICHVSFVVSRELRRVRFYLDKNEGKVVSSPL